jgi:hypothetical protein
MRNSFVDNIMVEGNTIVNYNTEEGASFNSGQSTTYALPGTHVMWVLPKMWASLSPWRVHQNLAHVLAGKVFQRC